MENLVFILPLFGVLALIFVFWRSSYVSKMDVGTEKMAKISKHIAVGAMAFLKAEYKILSIFVIALAIVLGIKGAYEAESNALVALSFFVGALCSGLAGFIGMRAVSYTHLTLPTTCNLCRSRWWGYH